MVKKDFDITIDSLRGVAILMVLLTHMPSISQIPYVGNELHKFVMGGTLWFVFISGFLFNKIECRQKIVYKDFFFKKFKRLWLPYIFWFSIAFFIALYVGRPKLYDLSNLAYLFWSFLVGGDIVGPMWYMPLAILFSILSPLLFMISIRHHNIFVVIALSFFILSFFTSRPFALSNPFLSFVNFFGIFAAGFICSKYRNIISVFLLKRWGVFVFLLIGVIVICSFFKKSIYIESTFYDNLMRPNFYNLSQICTLALFFIFFEKFLQKGSVILSFFAKISFGLFFSHGFFNVFYHYFLSRKISAMGLDMLGQVVFGLILPVIFVLVAKKVLQNRSSYVLGC